MGRKDAADDLSPLPGLRGVGRAVAAVLLRLPETAIPEDPPPRGTASARTTFDRILETLA